MVQGVREEIFGNSFSTCKMAKWCKSQQRKYVGMESLPSYDDNGSAIVTLNCK